MPSFLYWTVRFLGAHSVHLLWFTFQHPGQSTCQGTICPTNAVLLVSLVAVTALLKLTVTEAPGKRPQEVHTAGAIFQAVQEADQDAMHQGGNAATVSLPLAQMPLRENPAKGL